MTRICPCHRLPLIEEWSALGQRTILDTPLCGVTLIPQPAWYICDCEQVVGCADETCGGILWSEDDERGRGDEARELLVAVMEDRLRGDGTRKRGPGQLVGAHRVLALAELAEAR